MLVLVIAIDGLYVHVEQEAKSYSSPNMLWAPKTKFKENTITSTRLTTVTVVYIDMCRIDMVCGDLECLERGRLIKKKYSVGDTYLLMEQQI